MNYKSSIKFLPALIALILVFDCLICQFAHAAAAADPRMRKRMQMQREMKERGIDPTKVSQQSAPNSQPIGASPAISQPVEPKPIVLPPAKDIKETIDRVMKSSSEWLKVSDDNVKQIIIEYMLARLEDQGIKFEKRPTLDYQKKIDLMIAADPKILEQKTMPEILQSTANLDLNYIQTLYDSKRK